MDSKKSTTDDAYTISRDNNGNPEVVHLPTDWFKFQGPLTVLLGALLKLTKVGVSLHEPKKPTREITIPEDIQKYVFGISSALALEAKLPTEWKRKDRPEQIARQGVLFKRLDAWRQGEGFTYPFKFIPPQVAGVDERTDFSQFYGALSKLSWDYSTEYARCIKALLTFTCKMYPLDGNSLLDEHKIPSSALQYEAKPKILDKKGNPSKGVPHKYKAKPIWESHTHPMATVSEKSYMKSIHEASQVHITNFAKAWDARCGSDQYKAHSHEVKELRKMYTSLYTISERFSTGLSKRVNLYKRFLKSEGRLNEKKFTFDKKFVQAFASDCVKNEKDLRFSLIMDPRFVLTEEDRVFGLTRVIPIDHERIELLGAIFEEHSKYPAYKLSRWTREVSELETANVFASLSLDDGPDENQNQV